LTSTNVSVELADEIARFATLLSHPLRIRLLLALATNGQVSAMMLSVQLGGNVTLYDCHYHLRKLRDGGAIELVLSRSVRGATERVYCLAPSTQMIQRAMHTREFIDAVMRETISAGGTPPATANRVGGA
jgi:predicted ArsR family transcriptional regulator